MFYLCPCRTKMKKTKKPAGGDDDDDVAGNATAKTRYSYERVTQPRLGFSCFGIREKRLSKQHVKNFGFFVVRCLLLSHKTVYYILSSLFICISSLATQKPLYDLDLLVRSRKMCLSICNLCVCISSGLSSLCVDRRQTEKGHMYILCTHKNAKPLHPCKQNKMLLDS